MLAYLTIYLLHLILLLGDALLRLITVRNYPLKAKES